MELLPGRVQVCFEFRVSGLGVWGLGFNQSAELSFRAWADLLADTESPAAKGFSPMNPKTHSPC